MMECLKNLLNYPQRLYHWSSKPWPLHMFPVLVIMHLLFLQSFPESPQVINSYFSACFQIIGGLIVLHSINSNMRLFSKSNMIKEAYAWIKSFPLQSKNTTISAPSSMISFSSVSGNVIVLQNPLSVEEKVEHLLKEIKRIDSKIENTKKDFQIVYWTPKMRQYVKVCS